MPKACRIIISIFAVMLLLLVSACSGQTITQEDYEALLRENESLQEKLQLQLVSMQLSEREYNTLLSENERLKEQLELTPVMPTPTVKAKIAGGFSANVRYIIPDFLLDDFTPSFAVVTCFQDSPFAIYVGAEMASRLVVGETYFFELQEREIGEIPIDEVEINSLRALETMARYHLRIKDFRKPADNELGLEGSKISYIKID